MLRPVVVVAGSEHLTFKCNGCGDCCRRLRVAVTHRDLLRLSRGLGVPAAGLVAWLTPDDVDFEAEAASFVTFPAGPRLMILAHDGEACRLLRADGTCSAYAWRPLDCRAYPFVLERDDARRVTRLALFDPNGCGEHGPATSVAELAREDDERAAALAEYVALVARWNRMARHRTRLRHRAQGEGDFLAFLLTACS